MSHRRQLVAGNWKMNGSGAEARAIAVGLAEARGAETRADVMIAPPFTSLSIVAEALTGSRVALGGQNMHHEAAGAYTGEVSAGMLLAAGCSHVILGHSERRLYFGETDASVARKLSAALAAGLRPIVCVGETLAERDGGSASEVVGAQLTGALEGLPEGQGARLTIAYEPVWAIGTGRTATPDLAQQMHAFIRAQLEERLGAVAGSVRILYGGSVSPKNAAELLRQQDIDGALVGGASLKVETFVPIIDAACQQGASA